MVEYYAALKKEGQVVTCYNMDEPWRHAKQNKSDAKGQVLYDSIHVMYLE